MFMRQNKNNYYKKNEEGNKLNVYTVIALPVLSTYNYCSSSYKIIHL